MKEIIQKRWYLLVSITIGIVFFIKGILWINAEIFITGGLLVCVGTFIILISTEAAGYLRGLGKPIPFNKLKPDVSYTLVKIINLGDVAREWGIIAFRDNVNMAMSYAVIEDMPIDIKEGMSFMRLESETNYKIVYY